MLMIFATFHFTIFSSRQAVISTADWSKVLPTVKSLIVQRLTKQNEANPGIFQRKSFQPNFLQEFYFSFSDEKIDQLLKKIGEVSVEEGKEELKLSKAIRDKIDEVWKLQIWKITIFKKYFFQIKGKEEKQLMEGQIKEFAAWNAKRKELVEVQAEKLQLKVNSMLLWKTLPFQKLSFSLSIRKTYSL